MVLTKYLECQKGEGEKNDNVKESWKFDKYMVLQSLPSDLAMMQKKVVQ
jgi:hypothetical protein